MTLISSDLSDGRSPGHGIETETISGSVSEQNFYKFEV